MGELTQVRGVLNAAEVRDGSVYINGDRTELDGTQLDRMRDQLTAVIAQSMLCADPLPSGTDSGMRTLIENGRKIMRIANGVDGADWTVVGKSPPTTPSVTPDPSGGSMSSSNLSSGSGDGTTPRPSPAPPPSSRSPSPDPLVDAGQPPLPPPKRSSMISAGIVGAVAAIGLGVLFLRNRLKRAQVKHVVPHRSAGPTKPTSSRTAPAAPPPVKARPAKAPPVDVKAPRRPRIRV